MSIKNDDNKSDIKTINIDDVNVDNLGQGYVDDDNNNKVEVKEEQKHFLQALREAINEQTKTIEEEKKAEASETANKQAQESDQPYEPRGEAPVPIDNSECENSVENSYDGFEIEEM